MNWLSPLFISISPGKVTVAFSLYFKKPFHTNVFIGNPLVPYWIVTEVRGSFPLFLMMNIGLEDAGLK